MRTELSEIRRPHIFFYFANPNKILTKKIISVHNKNTPSFLPDRGPNSISYFKFNKENTYVETKKYQDNHFGFGI